MSGPMQGPTQDCPVEDAMAILTDMRERVVGLFLRLRNEILTDASPEIAAYT